jgi:uncharacterized protein DUF998
VDTHLTRTTAPASHAETHTADRLMRPLLVAGVVGPVLFVVALLIEGATRPGYSAWRHFVSQLSLSDQGWEQIANFLVCGLLCIGFAIGLRRAFASGKGAVAGPVALALFGAALIAAGIFSTDPALGYPPGTISPTGSPALHGTLHAMLHGLAGLVCFVSLAVACFVLARRFAGDVRWRGWAAYSILSGVVIVLFFIASNVTSVLDMRGIWPNAPTGLLQRIAVVAGWGWIALLAARLLRDRRSSADTRP